jgi:hypothetical protein
MAIKLERNLPHQVVTTTTLIVCVSVLPNGLGWMTEINAILVISLAFWVIRIPPTSNRSFFLLGLTLALLPFVRTNLGIPAFFLFVGYLLTNREFLIKIHIVLFGCLIPPLITSLPYVLSKNVDALWKGMFEIHLVSDRFGPNIDFLFGKTRFLLLLALLTFLLLSLRQNLVVFRGQRMIWIIYSISDRPFLLAFGITLSIFIDVPNYGHHLLQAAPVIVFLVMRIVSIVNNQRLLPLLFIVVFLAGIFKVQSETAFDRTMASERTQSVVTCIEKRLDKPETAWVINDIFLYWQTELLPVDSLVIHPATLMLPDFLKVFPEEPMSQSQGVERIISKKPSFIIFLPDNWFLTLELRKQLQDALQKNYSKQDSCGIKNFQIYKLKK